MADAETAAKLTDAACKKARPPDGVTATGKPIKQRVLRDSEVPGLELRVSRSGRKSWSLRYRPRKAAGGHGRQRRKMLGVYGTRKGEMSLAEARAEARAIIHGEAAKGRDPLEEQAQRLREVERQREKDRHTFRAVAGRYLDEYALGADVGPRNRRGELLDQAGQPADVWTYRVGEGQPRKRSWGEDRRKLKVEVLPSWGDRPVGSITRGEVRALVEAIARRGAPVQANRVRALLHKLFAWAVERDVLESNPATGTPRAGGSEKHRQRERVLTPDEVREFWAATEPGSDELMAAPMSAFWRLRLVTAQRAVEVVSMRWADIDLVEEIMWTVPGSVAKNAKSHRVPLSELSLEIVSSLYRHEERVLAGSLGNRQRSKAARLIHNVIEDFVGHDLRRTAASYMASAGVPRLHIAKVLNHSERGVTAVYDRHSYDCEKRVALDTWATRLRAIIERRGGGDVLPINAAS